MFFKHMLEMKTACKSFFGEWAHFQRKYLSFSPLPSVFVGINLEKKEFAPFGANSFLLHSEQILSFTSWPLLEWIPCAGKQKGNQESCILLKNSIKTWWLTHLPHPVGAEQRKNCCENPDQTCHLSFLLLLLVKL